MTLPALGNPIFVSDVSTEIGQAPTFSATLGFLNGEVLAEQRPTSPAMSVFAGKTYYANNMAGNCNNGNCQNDCACGNKNCGNCVIVGGVDCANCQDRAWLQTDCNCNCAYNCVTGSVTINCDCACNCSKIICANLHDKGLMPTSIWAADQAYGRQLRKTDKSVYRGYIRWARIITAWLDVNGANFMPWIKNDQVRLTIQKYKMLDMAVKIGTPWSEHMAYLMGAREQDNFMGRVLMIIGVAICRVVDKLPRVAKHNRKHGYLTVYTVWACLYFSYYTALAITKARDLYNSKELIRA